MEDFLDLCDAEEDDDDGFAAMYEADALSDDEDEDDKDHEDDKAMAEEERGALRGLAVDLLRLRREGYSLRGSRLREARAAPPGSRERRAATLVTSEMRTLEFFERAARSILARIGDSAGVRKEEEATDGLWEDLEAAERTVLEAQIADLVGGYLAVRHPHILAARD